MEQRTGSKLGKEFIKAVFCYPAYLAYTQSTSHEMPGWMNHKLESRLPGEIINSLRCADDTSLTAESKEELKSLLMKVKEESRKAGLKLNIQDFPGGPVVKTGSSWELPLQVQSLVKELDLTKTWSSQINKSFFKSSTFKKPRSWHLVP